jgi:transposase-like protein
MNYPDTHKIIPGKLYHFSEIAREIGFSRETLYRWAAKGLLRTLPHKPSACYGKHLIRAIEHRI